MECPTVNYSEVHKFMEKEYKKIYNKKVDELFDNIETVPLGSASIAQVHKGFLKDGTPVAIKVSEIN